jgi:DNA-binding GntR family transcriptional regulator
MYQLSTPPKTVMSKPAHAKVDRPPSPRAAQFIFEELQDKILSLQLAPATVLSRSKLQLQFGVSSTPVRDALMKLEQIGLVDVFPQSGTRVSLISIPLARQEQFLRRSIELEVVHALASSQDREIVHELRASLLEQRECAKARDLECFNKADLKFHKLMYTAANAGQLWDLVRRQSVHIDRIRRLHLPVKGKADRIIQDHSSILNAIADRDPDRAQSALRDHLSQSLAFSDELRNQHPTYFRY